MEAAAGDSRGVGGFLVLEQGTRDPHEKRHAEQQGLCSFGAEGSSGARLERFAARCCPCGSQQVIFYFFARADLATAL